MNHPLSVSHVFWDTSRICEHSERKMRFFCVPLVPTQPAPWWSWHCVVVATVNLAPGGNGPLLHFIRHLGIVLFPHWNPQCDLQGSRNSPSVEYWSLGRLEILKTSSISHGTSPHIFSSPGLTHYSFPLVRGSLMLHCDLRGQDEWSL